MKKNITKILVLALNLWLLPVAQAQYQWQDIRVGTSPWKMEKSEDGIEIETRTYQGSDFKMFRAHTEIAQPWQKVLSVLEKTEHFTDWYHKMSEVKELARSEQGTLRYSVTDLPWPVMDRDSVVFSQRIRLSPKLLKIQVEARPEAFPLQENRVRVPRLNGFWVLEAVSESVTHLYFEMAAEPGGEIPSWLANQLVVDMPYNTLYNLKQQLQKMASDSMN